MQKTDRRKRLLTALICLFLVLSSLWVYHPIRHHGATNCDDFYITDNSYLEKSGWNLETLVYVMTTVVAGIWMPITTFLIGHEYFLFGTDYGMYHVVCLLLHIANGVLLFFSLRMMTGALWKSALVAALFLLHPLNVEPVAWLVGIRVVLCGFFALAAIYLYALHVRQSRTWAYTLALFAFAVSITSVPMYMTLPCVLLLIDYWPLGRISLFVNHPSGGRPVFNWPGAGRLLWEKMPFFVLILGMSAIVLASHDLPFVHHHPLAHRALNLPLAYVQYLVNFFYPTGLSVFYPLPAEFPAWKVIGAVLLLLSVTIAALRTADTWRFFIVGWLWFAGMMVPLSGIVQIGTQAMADHYMYLPMIGLLLTVVWGADTIMGNWRAKPLAAGAMAAVAVIFFMATGSRQVRVWENSFTLSEHALRVTTGNYEAHNYLGHAFAQTGARQEAISHFKKALAIKPDHAKSHYNLANVYVQTGTLEKAEDHYRQALAADPTNPQAHNSMGFVLAAQGRLAEAVNHYQEAIRLTPNYFHALNNLATALAAAGRLEEAENHYRQALRIAPNAAPVLFNLADVLAAQKKYADAADLLQSALAAAPAMTKARLRLAEVLTTMGRPAEAARHYEHLTAQLPGSARLHYLAGHAFHASGQKAEARRHLQQALAIEPGREDARRLLREMEQASNPAEGTAPVQ